MSAAPSHSDYIVLDTGYIRDFVRELAPAFLDHVAIVSGIKPPDRSRGFTWCDLGCGQGVTALMLAAMHPTGQFYGIDLNGEHIAFAQRWANDASVGNVSFHACDFCAALGLGLPQFDYITLHGVYSWVGDDIRADVRTFIDRHLKPGGLVYVSYNALPGRAADFPLQRLVRSFAEQGSGSSADRVADAFKYVAIAEDLNATCITSSPMLATLRKEDEFPVRYAAHEYLAPNWDALCVTDVRRDMRGIGLVPAGRAGLVDNYDSLMLKRNERDALEKIANDDLRELMRDTLLNQSFRRDVFVRDGLQLGRNDQTQYLLNSTFGLMQQVSRVHYHMRSRTIVTNFDTATSRNIVAALAAGPRRLGDIVSEFGMVPADAVASILLLCACLQAKPTTATKAPVRAFNALIANRLGGSEEIRWLATPYGTVIRVNTEVADIVLGKSAASSSWSALCEVSGIDHIQGVRTIRSLTDAAST